jgi:hypothetical protein
MKVAIIISIFMLFTVLKPNTIDANPMMCIESGNGSLLKKTMHDCQQIVLTSKKGTLMNQAQELLLFDFRQSSVFKQWRSINDTVMGGISASQLQSTKEGTALFTGNVSLENNGGFASLQSQPSLYNLTGYTGITLRVRGDGKRYKLSLKNNAYLDTTRYESAFTTTKNEWITVTIPFRDLVPTFRGTLLNNKPPLDVSSVQSFGLLISDKQEGSFRLELEWIKAYSDE